MALWITNVQIDRERESIRLHQGRITHLGQIDSVPSEKQIDGEGHWLLPGLINAHDHLGLDLLPHLGNPPYPNSEAWGKEVYQPERSPIREVWQLSYRERLLWGAYRNLLSGVTTVQHHDRAHRQLGSLPIQVPAYRWCHRPGSKLRGRYGWTRHAPFFIHAAEGTDEASYGEVAQLHQQGKLGPKTVLIHGIALRPKDIELLAETGTGLVWCPSSNQFLYGQTAPIKALREAGIPLALGTDSTASGSDTLLAELQTVRGLLPDIALMELVTTDAARLLGVPERGQLRVGSPADLLLLDSRASNASAALLNGGPQDIRLVLVRGRPVLVRAPFISAFPSASLNPIHVNGELTMIQGPLPSLLKRTRQLLGDRRYFGQHIEPSSPAL